MGDRTFILLTISIFLILIDFYIYQAIRSISKFNWKRLRFSYIWWSYTFLLFIVTGISFWGNIPVILRNFILVLFFATIASKLSILLFTLLEDLRRGIIWVKQKIFPNRPAISHDTPPNQAISRSDFLIKAGILTASIPLASLTYGAIVTAYDYRVKRHVLYLPNLPKAFEGIRLGQLSDIHSGSFYNRKAVMGGINTLLKEKPDFIFFTGDLVNNLASEMRDYQDLFSKVKAPLGVFSVLGNHDYGEYYFGKAPSPAKARNLADIKTIHQNMGWNLLLNTHHKLKVNNEEIAIIGVENWGTGRFPKYGRMDLAVQGTTDIPVKLLLSHDPSHWRAQILPHYPEIDMMFSGHTHGMQLGVITDKIQWSPVQYIYKEWAGFYQEQHQQLYVNVGYGFVGYPGRLGVRPEITIFELKSGRT